MALVAGGAPGGALDGGARRVRLREPSSASRCSRSTGTGPPRRWARYLVSVGVDGGRRGGDRGRVRGRASWAPDGPSGPPGWAPSRRSVVGAVFVVVVGVTRRAPPRRGRVRGRPHRLRGGRPGRASASCALLGAAMTALLQRAGAPPRPSSLGPVRVGVLTGGGDCPGLNAVIRAAVRVGSSAYGHEHVGPARRLARPAAARRPCRSTATIVGPILPRGGTILGSSRTNPFKDAGGGRGVRERVRRPRPRRADRDRRRGHPGRGAPAARRART